MLTVDHNGRGQPLCHPQYATCLPFGGQVPFITTVHVTCKYAVYSLFLKGRIFHNLAVGPEICISIFVNAISFMIREHEVQ